MIKLNPYFTGISVLIGNKILNFKNEDLDLNGIKPVFQNILRKYNFKQIFIKQINYKLKLIFKKSSIVKEAVQRLSSKDLLKILEVLKKEKNWKNNF